MNTVMNLAIRFLCTAFKSCCSPSKLILKGAGSEASMAMKIQVKDFWIVMVCSAVVGYPHF
jgi:hypothetical protein